MMSHRDVLRHQVKSWCETEGNNILTQQRTFHPLG